MKAYIKKNIANFVTLLRLAGTIWLLGMEVSYDIKSLFMIVYLLCGFTDVLDGFLARRLNTQSRFGAKLDSVCDILFYLVAFLKFDSLQVMKMYSLRVPLMIVVVLRACCYIYVAWTKNEIHSRHTVFNKLLGLMVFLYPIVRTYSKEMLKLYIIAALVLAFIGTFEEMWTVFLGSERQDPIYKKEA